MEIVPFTIATQRVVLAKGMGCEFVRHQDAAQVGMTFKDNAEKVEYLPLHPVGTTPHIEHTIDPWIGVVRPGLHDEPHSGLDGFKDIPNAIPMNGVRVVEIVRRGQVNEEVKARVGSKLPKHFE
jgi:hypothetical protein